MKKIKNKDDLKKWIEMDLAASKMQRVNYKDASFLGKMHLLCYNLIVPNEIKKFLITLRKYEYIINTSSNGVFGMMRKMLWEARYFRVANKKGIDVFPNTIGPGLSVPHGKVVVSSLAEIGENCMILSDVTIGITNGVYKAAKIGNRVFIGSGARIIGDIEIADGVCIGANSVVTHSILEPNTTWAGIPARKINDFGTEKQEGMMVNLTKGNDVIC